MGLLNWFGRKKEAEDAFLKALMRESARRSDLLASGWMPMDDPYSGHPYPNGLIDITDSMGEDRSVTTLEYGEMHPMCNVRGKFWRPSVFSGPGKMIDGEVSAARPASSHARLP